MWRLAAHLTLAVALAALHPPAQTAPIAEGLAIFESGVRHVLAANCHAWLGFEHTKLTFRHAGRDYRLTDVAGNVVKEILSSTAG